MNKIKQLFINMYYVVSSNFLTLIVSIMTTLFLPRILGLTEYGYYQLYLFYIPYVSFLHFGWPDGIYLKYGGEEYSKLDKKYFKEQFYSLLLLQIFLSIVFLVILYINTRIEFEEKFIFFAVILNIILLNIRTFLLFILQMTNKMKEYSRIVIIDRLIFASIIVCLLLLREDQFLYYVVADLIAKLISLIMSVMECKSIIYTDRLKFKINFKEGWLNIKVGINIMLAHIAALFIIGVIRFGIQNRWGIETFGKISLTLSLSNILMVFISAISLALFPLLKRTNESSYDKTYLQIKTILMPLILGSLLLYFPMSYVLDKWLPAYTESVKYMAIVFPVIVFEGKVNLLTNTYLKVLRKERLIFKVNFVSAILSFIIGGLTIYIFDNLFLSILGMVILLAFRSIYADILLSKYMHSKPYKDIIIELFFVILFIILSWNYSRLLGAIFYVIMFAVYLYYQRRNILDTVTLVKKRLYN